MQTIVDLANAEFGEDVGTYVVVAGILLAGLMMKAIVSLLLPRLLSKGKQRFSKLDAVETAIRSTVANASFALVTWILLTQLAAAENTSWPQEAALWLPKLAQLAFLLLVVRAAFRSVDAVSVIVDLLDDDDEFDAAERTLISAVESILRFLIIIVGTLFIADALSFDITTLIAGLGISGIALALAAKDTISNVFGAVTVLLDRPFRIGDWIIAGGKEGEVVEIGLRTTLLRTSADTIITLPNASLVNTSVENFGKRRWRRYQPLLHFDLDTPPDKMESLCSAIEERIKSDPKTTNEGSAFAFVDSITAQAIDVKLNLYWDVSGGTEERQMRQKLLLDISRIAEKEGISFFEPRVRSQR